MHFIEQIYHWQYIFVRNTVFQMKCLNNFATGCSINMPKSVSQQVPVAYKGST